MGLVRLVLAGRTKRAIQRLTQTFLTLSLTDIAQQVGLQDAAEAEGHILRYCIRFQHLIAIFCICTCLQPMKSLLLLLITLAWYHITPDQALAGDR